MKMLKRHLQVEHGITVDEYRQRWDLKSDYPVVAPEYAAKRKELAEKIGLGRKPGTKIARKKAAAAEPQAESAAPAPMAEKSPRKREAKAAEA